MVNTYFAGTGTAAANAKSISVAASGGANTAVAVGDLLLVIQMQGADINPNNTNAYGSNTASGAGYLTTNFTAGQYEYVVATSALATGTAGSISISTGLVNSYSTAAATSGTNATGRRSFQVVRIPQYNSVTLGGTVSAMAWDGNMGGVLVMDVAGALNLNGQTLSAAGLGFRGGGGKLYTGGTGLNNTDYRTSNSQPANGAKGEGIAGTPRYTLAMQALTTTTAATDNSTNAAAFGTTAVTDGYPNGDNGRGAPGNAGGGGTDDVPNSGNGSNSNGINVGGAGGGNGGKGGLGGWPRINGTTIDTINHAIGGVVFTQATTSRLVMGGGGGAGTNNNGDGGVAKNGTGAYSSGAAGGGLILVRTASVSGTGTADASGAAGILLDASGTGSNDGAGGGGAGGTVLFIANATGGLANLTVLATGGVGGSNKDANDVAHGTGGGGGGGIVLTNGSVNAASSVAGGKPGTTTSNDTYNGTFYGAKQGAMGSLTTNNSTSINNSIAGADCLTADVVTTLSTTQSSVAAGASITYQATVQNNGPGNSAGVAPQVQLPAGLTAAAFTSLPTGASYNNNTGVLTLPTTTSLAYGAANALTYNFTFTAPNYTTTVTGTASSTATTTDPTAANNNGTAANAQVQTVVTLPNNSCAGTPYSNAGSGLYAEYYAGYFADDLTFFTKNTAGLTRTDGTINFPNDNSWGNIIPPATGGNYDNPDGFSARYRGSINIAAAGSYTFYLASDDASYMWIDAGTGNPTTANAAINNGTTHGATTKQVTLTLTAGPHNILILYGEAGGDNILTLQYSGGPNNIAQQTVPNSLLCPTSAVDLATIISGPSTAVVGQTVYYQATTTNNGAGSATDASTTITLANKPAASTVTVTGGSYDATTGIVTFTNGTLAAGASVVNTVSFVAQASPTTATGQAASTTSNADANAANNNGSATNANVTTTVAPTGASGTAANCATAGKDGAVASLTTNPNAYYPSATTQTVAAGATTISVGAATGAATDIKPGDLLLVIQMQGADINATNTDSYGDGVAGGSANGSSVTTNFTAGQYEYVTVATTSGSVTAAAGGTITLATGLKNAYASAAATATAGQRSFQVVRVPQYSTLTLGAKIMPTPWNGSTGGIVALDVDGQLNFNNFTIDASGTGFRGGAGRQLSGDNSGTTSSTDYRFSASLNTGGIKGEGTAGTPRYVNNNGALLDTKTAVTGVPTTLAQNDGYPGGDNGRGAPGNAGGGSTDGTPTNNAQNSGGGGGANGGRGGRGGNAWNSGAAVGGEPGAAFPAASSSRLVLGGGGGAGTTNDGTGNGTPSGFASSGAAGGGIVLVRTGAVSGTGSILANGAIANNSVANDGSGGAGAGGSVLLTATTSTAGLANITLTAQGGTGNSNTPGNGATAHGPGGGGGGGIILANGAVNSASSVAAGANGTTFSNGTSGTIAFGAEAGTTGVSNTSISNTIANSTAGANCIADVATTITGPATAGAGQATGTFTATYTNQGAVAASSVTQTVVLPAGANLTAAQQQDLITRYGLTASSFTTSGTGTSAVTTINFGTVTTLAAGASNSFTFAYNAPTATGNSTTTSNTSTTTSEGGLTANNTASVTTNVTPVADVTVALTGPTTVSAGQATGTFTATFTNEGPQAASSVTQTITLPTGASLTAAQQQDLITRYGLTASSFTTSGTGTSAVTTINFGTANTLASNASNAFTFAFTAPSATGSSTIGGSTSTTSSEGNNVAPDATSLALTTTAVADVTAAITASSATVAPGATGTFNVTFANNGPQDAAGVTRTVQLPTGLSNVTASNGGTYSISTGLVTYASTTITSGSSSTSTITFTEPTNGTVTGTASVSTTTQESNTTNNVAAATITAGPSFDLTTSLTGPTTAVAGSPVTLNVTTTNNGPQAVAGAVQTVQLPKGLNAAGAPNVFVSNGGTYDNGTGIVTFPALGTLPSGQTVANTITFSSPGSAFAPSAQVTPNTTAAGETNTANNTAYLNGATASTNITVNGATANSANIYAILTTTSKIVAAGTQVTYTAGVGNAGPATANNVTGQLELLPGLTTSTLTVGGQTGTQNGNVITFSNTGVTYNTTTGILNYATLPTLASGSTAATQIVVTVPSTVGNNGQLLATLSVGSATSDTVPADNTKAVTVTVIPTTDLATTIAGPTSIVAGQSVSYTATFTNNGPDAATATTETVQLPTGLSGVAVTDASGAAVTSASYSATTGLVTLPAIASDAVGSTQTYNVAFTAPAQGYTVSSAVGSTTSDTNAANNSASVATTVSTPADVAVAISGPATAVAGNPVTYAVTTSNNGPGAASGVAATLQLPTGLSGVSAGPNGGSYNANTGVVTFATVNNLPAGGSAVNFVTFTMPNGPTNGQVSGVAAVTTTSTDNVAGNNTAGITTDVAPTTTTVANLIAGAPSPSQASPVTAGTALTYTFNYQNAGSSPSAAVNAAPVANLPAGLTGVTVSNGGVYNSSTGQVTWPVIASMSIGQQVSYTVAFNAPGSGQIVAVSSISSATTDSDPTNNRGTSLVNITAAYDATTSINGPATALPGATSVYEVTTTNNGPSTDPSTTQTVTLPNKPAAAAVTNISNGGSYDATTGIISYPAITNLASGASVTNTFTLAMPASGSQTLNASVTSSGESNTNNNTATLTTTPSNYPPVAQNIINSLQSVRGNTAVALPISSLNAADQDGSIASYYVQSLPTNGTLYDGTTQLTSIPTGGYKVSGPDKLSFKPSSGFVGNAFFTYTSTDNGSAGSNTALYTIPVAQDQNTAYTATPAKGATNKYATNDVLASVIDPNTAVYNSGGQVYGTTGGTTANGTNPLLQSGAANGLPTSGTNATLASTGPAASGSYPANSSNTLPAGVSLDPITGLVYVSDASKLPRVTTTTYYQVNVITTDLNGGTNTTVAQFMLGAYPLPVELVSFTAQAVQNRDAQLSWTTASELHNDHFEVERSLDGSTFAKVGQVAGQGSKATSTSYAFTDAGIGPKVSAGQPVYYRLRQVDADGTATYSPVRTVSFTGSVAAAVSLYPNPATSATSLDLSALPATGSYQVLLLDATGRQVRQATLAGGLVQALDLHELATGTYQVLLTGQQADGSPLRQVLRLIKE